MARVEMPNSRARSAMAKSSRLSCSGRFTLLLFPRRVFLAELLLAQLADERFRQLVLEDDFARHLKLVELVCKEAFEFGLAHHRSRAEFDEGNGRLAAMIVRHTDHVVLVDGRMLGERFLDGAGIDVEAGADDEILDAVDEENVTLVVDVADVA